MFYRNICLIAVLLGGLFTFAKPVWSAAPGEIVINELMWMGSSTSAADEWIELRNLTSANISLEGWTLLKKTNGSLTPMLTLPAGSQIPAGGFFLIANYAETDANSQLTVTPDVVATAVSLVNSDLQIVLADAAGQVIDTADDGQGTPLAGKYNSGAVWQSMERDFSTGDGQVKDSWHTASARANLKDGPEFGTPKSANSNLPPEIRGLSDREVTVDETVPFDVSESVDPEGDPVTFIWNFMDGSAATGATPVHRFARSGIYPVKVIADDGQARSETTAQITVRESPAIPSVSVPASAVPPAPAARVAPTAPAAPTPAPSSSATTSSPMPSSVPPVLAGLGLSELFIDPGGQDKGQEFIELANLTDRRLSTAGWTIANGRRTLSLPGTEVGPGAFLVLQAQTLPISLVNGGDTIYLMNPERKIMQGVKYGKAKTGQGFAWIGRRWAWTQPSPGEPNELPESADAEAAVDEPEIPRLSVAEARQAAANTKLRLEGTVAAILDPRTAVVADPSGMLVLTFNATANLSVGMEIQVEGRKSTAREPRVRGDAATLRIIGQGTPALPTSVALGDLDEEDAGLLVRVSGTVLSKRQTSLKLEDESGTLSVRVPAGTEITKGATVQVTGIVRVQSGQLSVHGTEVQSVSPEPPVQVAGAQTGPQAPVTLRSASGVKTSPWGYAFMGIAGVLVVVRQILLGR